MSCVEPISPGLSKGFRPFLLHFLEKTRKSGAFRSTEFFRFWVSLWVSQRETSRSKRQNGEGVGQNLRRRTKNSCGGRTGPLQFSEQFFTSFRKDRYIPGQGFPNRRQVDGTICVDIKIPCIFNCTPRNRRSAAFHII